MVRCRANERSGCAGGWRGPLARPVGSARSHDLPPTQNLLVMRTLADEDLDRAFSALADPTRRAILARLRTGEAGVLEIADPLPMSQPAISKHLKVLEAAGLVSRRRHAKHHLCRLEAARLRDVSDWLGTYRDFWEDSFARLDEYVEALQAEGPPA
jgi:DNA-binding transcriptional ArsR family regulator